MTLSKEDKKEVTLVSFLEQTCLGTEDQEFRFLFLEHRIIDEVIVGRRRKFLTVDDC